MIRFYLVVGYLLSAAGFVASCGGVIAGDLTPLVLGGILTGLGGVLHLLARLERRLAAALPALDAISKTAHYLSLRESVRAASASPPDLESGSDGLGVRNGPSGPVGAHPTGGDGAGARA